MIKSKFLIQGRVQGIFFRKSTKRIAENLGIYGWVRNLPTGEVEVLAIGKQKAINEFIKWLKIGPKFARVDKLKILSQRKTNKSDGEFLIRPDA